MMRTWFRVIGLAALVAALGALALSSGPAAAAPQTSKASANDVSHSCPAPPNGHARCGAIQLLNPAQNWHPSAHAHPAKGKPGPSSSAPPSGYYPIDLQSAYGLANAVAAETGPGPNAPTIAVVDANDDPNAAADLATYRSTMSKAQDPSTKLTDGTIPPLCSSTVTSGCVTFTKVNQSGGTSYPRANKGWAEEISLDLDMASAICPDCNITLVEASSSSFSNLETAVSYAKSLSPAVVTNSYGGGEFSSEASANGIYSSSGSTAMTVATGDNGYGAEFPAAAPKLTAVGGTSLTYTGTGSGLTWNPQTVWSGSGAGCSAYELQPSWQASPFSVASTCSNREIGDIAAVADPNTGVAVYDTYNASGWMVFGGTSASTQIIGGMYGLAAFQGDEQASPSALYGNAGGNITPVASGSDGSCGDYLCDATQSLPSGYNGPTGLGTPSGIGAFTGTASTPPPSTPTFTVGATTSTATVNAGSSASYTVAVTPSNGYTGTVTLTPSGCPTSTCSLSSTSSSFNSSTDSVTFTSSNNTTPVDVTLTVPTTSSDSGTYSIAINGSDGTISSTADVSLTVNSTSSAGTINASVTAGSVTKKGPNYHVPLTVAATDSSGAPLSGASATVDIYYNCAGSPTVGTGTTGSNGQVSFTFTTKQTGNWCVAASVSDAGYTTGTASTTFTTP